MTRRLAVQALAAKASLCARVVGVSACMLMPQRAAAQDAPISTRPVEQPGNPVPPAAASPIPRPAPPALNPTPEASADKQAERQEPATDPVPAPTPTPESPDTLATPGNIPGYRTFPGLGLSPYAPRIHSNPGPSLPPFGVPTPPEDWSFTWSGYMSATFVSSIGDRVHPAGEGQTNKVFHSPPQTAEEWQSFTSTSPVQTSWIGMNFLYGSQYATAQVSIATWNPSRGINNYQLGSQYFINDAFVRLRAPALAGVRLSWNVGYFSQSYGNLGRYGGGGLYTNPISGQIQGVGETTIAEYDFSDTLVGILEHGIMGNRGGAVPVEATPSGPHGGYSMDPNWLSAWIHHAHLGLLIKGDVQYQFQLHYLTQWSQDERSQIPSDDHTTQEIDETYVRDGRLRVFGFDARVIHPAFGLLAIGGSYVNGSYAYPLRGLTTYGGEGERLTNSWWGDPTTGTGTLIVGAINYQASLGRIVTYPDPFPNDHPDVNFDVGCHIATTATDYDAFDARLRYKCGVNALYTFLPWLGVGARVDRVVPNSKDSEETFHALAARIQFKTDWNSREAVNLTYGKWFYGSRTRSDSNYPRLRAELDDQLIALNFNMWW